MRADAVAEPGVLALPVVERPGVPGLGSGLFAPARNRAGFTSVLSRPNSAFPHIIRP
jgi:hypothetical protein